MIYYYNYYLLLQYIFFKNILSLDEVEITL